MREPAQVDLIHHLLQAAALLAEEVGERALKADLARGHGTGAELLLQADDAIGVAAAILQGARHQEEGKPTTAGAGALGPGQHQDEVAVDVGAEPLVAMDPPVPAVEAGLGLQVADVGAAGLLGHELGAGPDLVAARRQHPWQVTLAELRRGIAVDHEGGGIADADRAHQPELALDEEVLHGILGQRRQRRRPAEHAGSVAHGVQAEVVEGDALHLPVGRMVLDPVPVPAGAVAERAPATVPTCFRKYSSAHLTASGASP